MVCEVEIEIVKIVDKGVSFIRKRYQLFFKEQYHNITTHNLNVTTL